MIYIYIYIYIKEFITLRVSSNDLGFHYNTFLVLLSLGTRTFIIFFILAELTSCD